MLWGSCEGQQMAGVRASSGSEPNTGLHLACGRRLVLGWRTNQRCLGLPRPVCSTTETDLGDAPFPSCPFLLIPFFCSLAFLFTPLRPHPRSLPPFLKIISYKIIFIGSTHVQMKTRAQYLSWYVTVFFL